MRSRQETDGVRSKTERPIHAFWAQMGLVKSFDMKERCAIAVSCQAPSDILNISSAKASFDQEEFAEDRQ